MHFLQPKMTAPLEPAAAPRGFALWNLGFRPFYLLASLFAALSVPLWAAQYAGLLPFTYVQGPVVHGQEMLFGFTLAVVVGFLFTAVRNWTNLPTPTGTLLAALALLWIAGRVAALTPFDQAAAWINAAFPLTAAIGIGVPMLRARNKRNYFFIGLLLLLSAVGYLLHAPSAINRLPSGIDALHVGLDVILFIIAVMGGRVIPMFTNNGIPGAGATRHLWVERSALASLLALLAADILQAPAAVLGTLCAVAAAAHAARLGLWRPWRTRSAALVWILHAGYAWVVAHLLLRTGAEFGLLMPQLAVHALTVGAIGGLTIGMMTRTARGHTGHTLHADRYEVACYVLIQSAAIVRVFGGIALPGAYAATVIGSSVLWSLGFAIYFVHYWPILTRPRIDGKPG